MRPFLPVLLITLIGCGDSPSKSTADTALITPDNTTTTSITTTPNTTTTTITTTTTTGTTATGPPSTVGPRAPGPDLCTAGGAGCYYASPAGVGTVCSQSEPCQIQDALPLLGAGDTLVLEDGVYDQRYEAPAGGFSGIISIHKYFSFASQQTAASPITITAAAGATPIIDGGDGGQCVLIDGEDFVIIEKLTIRNCSTSGIRVGYDVPVEGIIVRDNDFYDIRANDNMGGVYAHSSRSLTIEDNRFHDNDYERNGVINQGVGIVLFRAVDTVIQYNEFFNLSEGLYFKHGEPVTGQGGSTLFANNHFYDITRQALGTNQNRSEIRDNLFVGAGVSLHNEDGTLADFTFDARVTQNTFVDAGISLSRGSSYSGAKDTTILNNIITGWLSVWTYGDDANFNAGVGLDAAANCVYQSSGPFLFDYFSSTNPAFGGENTGGSYTLADWQALGFGVGSVEADPQFVDATNGDYRLAAGSPCAGMGAL